MPDPTLPTQVMVGVVCYQISADPDDWMRIEHQEQRNGGFGFTEARRARIYLNPDQPESQMRLTLWHEVLHAVFESGMGRPSWTKLGGSTFDREERVVRMLEAPTLNVLADNPDLVAYLTA